MSDNLLFSEKLLKIISKLSNEKENFEELSGGLADIFAEDLDIGRIERYDHSMNLPENEDIVFTQILYNKDSYDHEKQLKKFYKKLIPETVEMIVYHTVSNDEWSDKQIEQIYAILDLLWIYGQKFHLYNKVINDKFIDTPTGIYNIDGFKQQVRLAVVNNNITDYSALYININGLKLINSKYGASGGDEVLFSFAQKIDKFAEKDEIAARLGGDNFIMVVKNEHLPNLIELLHKTNIVIHTPLKNITESVTTTFGIYNINKPDTTPEDLMQYTGIAYSIAKNVYHKEFMIYTDELGKRLLHEKEVMSDFEKAIKAREFVVFYQPKVETQIYSIVGAEALVRWVRNGEVIPPDSFIPILEKSDAICKLDYYVLDQVCRDISEWIKKGLSPVRISINMSRKHLASEDMTKIITKIISDYNLPHELFEIELTETVNGAEQDALKKTVDALKNADILTSIDDFGTGYSSLNMLRNVSVDILKIDKSFISNSEQADTDRIVLKNIIHMSRELGIEVITEGVEKKEKIDYLKELGCYLVQGYVFDKPLPENLFETRLKSPTYINRIS